MGGKSSSQTIGYRYFLGLHLALCHGPIDYVRRIRVDKRTAWESLNAGGRIHVDAPSLFGGDKREGGISGDVDMEFGASGQGVNDYLSARLGSLVPACRGVCAAVLRQCYLGNNPYLKAWDFRCQRIHVRQDGLAQWYDATAEIGTGSDLPPDPYQGVSYVVSDGFPSGLDFRRPDGTRMFVTGGGNKRLYQYDLGTAWELGGAVTPAGSISLVVAQPYVNGLAFSPNGKRFWVLEENTFHSVWIRAWNLTTAWDISTATPAATATPMPSYAHQIAFTGDGSDLYIAVFPTRKIYHYELTSPWEVPSTLAAADTITLPFSPSWLAVEAHGVEFYTQNATTATVQAWRMGTLRDVSTAVYDRTLMVNTDPAIDNDAAFVHPDGGRLFTADGHNHAVYQFDVYLFSGRSPDMNPAHIIRECITDPDWGMGYPEADIDDVAFALAADTLYTEGLGLSLLWDRSLSIEEFVLEIARHIDAALYTDRTTGLWVLRLIRDDYDPLTIPVLDESTVERIEGFSRPSFGELVNQVTVTYWDSATGEDATLTVTDDALVQMQGQVIGQSVRYPGITRAANAERAAQRDLRALSAPLASCTLYAARSAGDLNLGDAFRLVWPDYGLDEGLVMRVTEIAYGDAVDGRARVRCTEDVFASPATRIVAGGDTDWTDPVSAPLPPPYQVLVEAPYYELVQMLGQQAVDDQIAYAPDLGYVLAAAARPSDDAINARLLTDAGAGYEDRGTVDWCPVALLAADLPREPGPSTVAISDGVDLDDVVLGTHAQIGAELVRVDAISESSVTLGRGVLDTLPAAHSTGTPILFWDRYAASDEVEYVAAETVDALLLTVTGAATLDEADATAESVTLDYRAQRPYPPAGLTVNGGAYPETIGGTDLLSLAWVGRDRIQQTGGEILDAADAGVGPEAGATYTLRIYGEDDTLGRTETGITGSPYVYAEDDEKNDFFGAPTRDYPGAVMAHSPAGYWRFGEASGTTAADSSGNGRDGTYYGTYALGEPGLIDTETDTCVDMLQSGYVVVSNPSAVFQMVGYTWGTTINFDSFSNSPALWHVGDFTVANQQGLAALIDPSGHLKLSWFNGAWRAATTTNVIAAIGNTAQVVVRFDDSTHVSVLVDGAFVEQMTTATIQTMPSQTLKWGAMKGSSYTNKVDGRLDEGFVIQSLLTDEEIAVIYEESQTVAAGTRLQGRLRCELEAVRDGLASWQHYNVEVRRPGWTMNWDMYWDGGT